MTCICGHEKADHQEPYLDYVLDTYCDICRCPGFVADEALAAVEAYEDGAE